MSCFIASKLQRYHAMKGDTGVIAYQTRRDSIAIQFKDGSVYLYTYASTGKVKIEKMKKLAMTGKGLTTYINQNVRDRYAAKVA